MAAISEAHAAAARTNGAQSNGPVTEEGKAHSSKNATTHGLTAQTLIIEPNEMEEYLESVRQHFAFINPVGPIETTLCKRMIDSTWNIRRAGILEVKLKEKAGEDPLISSDHYIYRQAVNLLRHKNTHTRGYDKAWKELQSLQTQRRREEEARRTAPQEEARKQAEAAVNAIRTQQKYADALNDLLGPDIVSEEKPRSTAARSET